MSTELMAREFASCWKVIDMHQCVRFLIYLTAGIKNYIVTKDKKIGHLSQSFLDDLQVVFEAKAAVAKARRDEYELKRRDLERKATKKRCDDFEAAAASFLNESLTANVNNVPESQAAVRSLVLQSVSQPGYYSCALPFSVIP